MRTDRGVRGKRDERSIDRRRLVFYLRVLDEMSHEILGYLIDISPQGIKLMGEGKVGVNRNYCLRMRLPTLMKKDRDEITFSAISKWCETDKSSGTYLAGFQMDNLCSATRKLIRGLVRDFGHNKAG